MPEDIKTEKVLVHTLRAGDKIVRWNGDDGTVCPIDVTWEGAAPDYWAVDPVEGRIRLPSDSTADKVVAQPESGPHSTPIGSRRWGWRPWNPWRR
jgi:hypothetical protein